ncbi:hypothetical protein L9F63_024554, partial [Diploptera punctata]
YTLSLLKNRFIEEQNSSERTLMSGRRYWDKLTPIHKWWRNFIAYGSSSPESQGASLGENVVSYGENFVGIFRLFAHGWIPILILVSHLRESGKMLLDVCASSHSPTGCFPYSFSLPLDYSCFSPSG